MAEKDVIPKWRLAATVAMESIGLLHGAASWRQNVSERPVAQVHAVQDKCEKLWETPQVDIMNAAEKSRRILRKPIIRKWTM